MEHSRDHRHQPGLRTPLLALGVLWCATACDVASERYTEFSRPGNDCTPLLEAARRAQVCDPALARLAETLTASRAEPSCRAAARRLLEPPSQRVPVVTSALPQHEPPEERPLTRAEREALANLPLPAELAVRPDQPPGPGVPSTAAELGELALDSDSGGLRGAFVPGHRTLTVRHAGHESQYCVLLRECEPLQLIAHGAHIARHPQVRPGPCP